MQKKIKIKIALSIALVFLGIMGFGQSLPPIDTTQWHVGDLSSPDADYKTIKEKAEAYFAAHPEIDSINPMARKTYKRWESYWKNRSALVIGDTIITNIGKITEYIASLDFAIVPGLTPKWKCISPDESEFQNLGVITATWSKPNDPNYILAGTESAGLWKTTDGGQNWVNITDSYNGYFAPPVGYYYHYPFGILSIAVHPNNSNMILIAASVPTGIFMNWGYGIGVLKSTDGGNTWSKTSLFSDLGNQNTGLNYPGITKILIDPANPNWVYAIGGLKVYFSNNLFDANQVILDCNISTILGFPLSDSRKLKFRDIEVLDIIETSDVNDRKIFVSTDSYNNFSAQLLSYNNSSNSWSNITNLLSHTGFKDVIAIENEFYQNGDNLYNNLYVAYQINEIDPNNPNSKKKFCVDRLIRNGTNMTYNNTQFLYHDEGFTSPCAGFGYYYDSFEWVNREMVFIVGGYGITLLDAVSDHFTTSKFSFYKTCNYTTPYLGGTIPNDEWYGKNKTLHFGVRAIFSCDRQVSSPDYRFTTFVGTEGGISRIKHSIGNQNTLFELKNINGKGLAIQQFNDITTTSNNSEDIIIGGAMHNGYWGKKIENANWENYWFDDGGKVVINDANSNFLYAMSYSSWNSNLLPNQLINGGYFLRSDDGLKLSPTSPLIKPYFDWSAGQLPPQDIASVPPLIVDQNNSNTLYLGGHDIYKSINNGNTWTKISTMPNNNVHAKTLKAIAQSASNTNIMFAAFEEPTWCRDFNNLTQTSTPTNIIYYPFNCHLTNTHKLYKYDGSSWNDISQSVLCQNALTWAPISDIVINPFNENEIWTTHSSTWSSSNNLINTGINRVLHSTNGGQSWSDYSEGLSCMSVNCIRFVKVNSDPNDYMLIIGTDVGVYYRYKSFDLYWTRYVDGLPVAIVNDIEVNEKSRKIRASTWGRGIWEADIPCRGNSPFYIINSDQTWNTDRAVTGIVVKSGKTLTINSNVFFQPSTGIVVEQGATLILNNASLTACERMWNGIKVYGDYSFSQTVAGKHGKIIINNGLIKDAIKAISTVDINNVSRGGGIYEINGGSFINNMISIYMQEFKNPNNLAEKSYIHNARFVVNDDYRDNINNPFSRFIYLVNINKLSILGCKLANNKTYGNGNNYMTNGIGIRSYNSVFYVKNYCNDPNPQLGICPPQYAVSSEFRNLEYGIYATSDNPIKNFTVKNTTFDKNYRGIFAMSINNASFTSNTFKAPDIPLQPFNSVSYDGAYGLYLMDCSGYTVEANLFDKTDNAPWASLGMLVYNSGSPLNSIYNNTFKNIKYVATLAQEINRSTLTAEGLKIKCNDYLNNSQDIGVTDFSGSGGISQYQGADASDPTDPFKDRKPAGNRFSKIVTTTLTDIDNTLGKDITYFYHNDNGDPTNLWVPQYCNPAPKITKTKNQLSYFSKALSCPAIATAASNIQPYNNSSLMQDFAQNTLNYNSARLIMQIWVDGGNTPELVQTTELAYPWEAYMLYNELMAASPYLSDEVLIAAIQNEDALPALMLKLILLANPQAVRSGEVMDALRARSNPFPDEWLEELEQGLETISPRELLEAEVSYYASERKTYLDLLKQYYLADTAANGMQNLQNLISAETDIDSRYELVFAKIANNEYEAANTLLENMESALPENDMEVSKYYKMRDILAIISQLNSEEGEWETIDQNKVIELSENNDDLPAALAKAIRLHYDESYTYAEPIYVNENTELKSATTGKINKNTAITDKQNIKISPNPANNFVIVEYTNDKIAKEVLFLVYDIQGRLHLTQQLKKIANQSLIDISKLTNGTYQCKLVIDGQQKAVKKLIVQH